MPAPCTASLQPSRPQAAPGAPRQLTAMAATRYKPATVLVVNTLTSKPGETPHSFLHRNGLDTHLLQDMQLVLFPEFGVPQADRNDRFNGVTMAVLELKAPEGREVPLQNGLAFSPSKVVRLASGESFQQRFIQICDQRLEFTTPLPQVRPGWPLPLERFLACASQTQAEPISHHHPSGSLGRPGRLDRGRSLPVCEGPSSLARGLLPHQRHLDNAPRDSGP